MTKTNILKTLIAVATIFIGLTFTQCGVSDRQLQEITEEANSAMGCPVDLSPTVRFDKIYAVPGKEIHFRYTWKQSTKEQIEQEVSLKEFDNIMKATLLSMINENTEEMEVIRNTKAILVVECFDKNGELFSEVKAEPKEYN